MAMARSNRWRRQTGQLTNPFKKVKVLGPSPLHVGRLGGQGWPKQDMEAALELQEVDLKHRLVGNQPDPHPLRDAVAQVFDQSCRQAGPALQVPRAGGRP